MIFLNTFMYLSILSIFPFLGRNNDSLAIDQAVKKKVAEQQFSGTVLVAHQGKTIYHQSFGYAYIPAQDTIQNNYHYSIASVTKLFTSIRILQLLEKNRLDLNQSLADFFPDWQIENASKITLHHLLLHISGLPNEKDAIYRHPLSPQDFAKETLKNKAPAQRNEFNYNNLDYVFLGLVIEKITGNAWQDEIQKNILDKIQLNNTGFLAYGRYPKKFAYTYQVSPKGKYRQDPFYYIENFYAAACMYATSEDLLKLDQALYTQQLLSKESYQILAKSYPEFRYAGYSVWNYRYPFVESKPLIMERRGGILGANVVLVRLPETQHTIIILSNNDRFNPDSFGDENNLRETLIRILTS